MLLKSIFFLIKTSIGEKHSNKKIPLAAHYKQPERKEKIKKMIIAIPPFFAWHEAEDVWKK